MFFLGHSVLLKIKADTLILDASFTDYSVVQYYLKHDLYFRSRHVDMAIQKPTWFLILD